MVFTGRTEVQAPGTANEAGMSFWRGALSDDNGIPSVTRTSTLMGTTTMCFGLLVCIAMKQEGIAYVLIPAIVSLAGGTYWVGRASADSVRKTEINAMNPQPQPAPIPLPVPVAGPTTVIQVGEGKSDLLKKDGSVEDIKVENVNMKVDGDVTVTDVNTPKE